MVHEHPIQPRCVQLIRENLGRVAQRCVYSGLFAWGEQLCGKYLAQDESICEYASTRKVQKPLHHRGHHLLPERVVCSTDGHSEIDLSECVGEF